MHIFVESRKQNMKSTQSNELLNIYYIHTKEEK